MPEVRLLGGALRKTFGARKIDLAGETLGAVVEALVELGGEEVASRVYEDPRRRDPEKLDRDLRLLVNGRNAQFLEGLETPVSEQDVVTVHFAGSRAFPGG